MLSKVNPNSIRNILVATTILLAILFLPLTTADSIELYCLEQGEIIRFDQTCNPLMEPLSGPSTVCVHIYDTGQICPTNFNLCGSGLSCSGSTQAEIDQSHPELEISSPAQDNIYTERSVALSLDSNEIADISFQNLHSSSPRWTTVCRDCSSYNRERTFDEGMNELEFRAEDRAGNIGFQTHTFFIDSREPRIRSAEPRRGFASGEFEVEFAEENPQSLVLHYGNFINGMRSRQVDLQNCVEDRSNTLCSTQVDLTDFDEQTLEFHFSLEDIAGNTDESSSYSVQVDQTAPILDDFSFNADGRYATFFFDITEINFDEVLYIDNLDSRPRWRRLCSRLPCERRVSFRDGSHNLDFKIIDEAGNEVMTSAFFFTDSRDPRIASTEPRTGFASGDFEVDFVEQNPDYLALHFGNSQTGMHTLNLDLGADCLESNNGRFTCSTSVPLSDFDGQTIDYWFELIDRLGQTDESRPKQLEVDTTFPVINDISHVLDGTRAEVTISAAEQNLDEISYINHADSFPRERRLCSYLENGMCGRRIPIRGGLNEIEFTVLDEAGNSASQNYDIFV